MTTTEGQCAVCSKPGKLCASCENIHYCGRDCQKADWAVHKLLCRSFKNARDPPGPNMMRVIVFPFNSTKIEFRWMPINRRKVHHPNSGHFFGTDNQWKKNSPALTDFRSFVQDPKTGKRLRHRITIQFRDEYQTDGSIPNIAINNLVGGSSLLKFAGPIIAYGNVDVKQDTQTQSINLDTSDLNIIKDWFTYGFFKCKNEQFYRDRLEGRGNVLNVDETKECIDAWEKEQRAMGKPVREFTAEEAGSPEWVTQMKTIDAYKKNWDAKKKAEKEAKEPRVEKDFSSTLSEEELAWREELSISGRMYGRSAMEDVVECHPWLADLAPFRSKKSRQVRCANIQTANIQP